MSLAVQSLDQHLTSLAASTAVGRNHEIRRGEAAGLERSNVSRERLITRSDDGYFNTDTTTDHLDVTEYEVEDWRSSRAGLFRENNKAQLLRSRGNSHGLAVFV
jgi:hypothetical protein